MWWLSLLVGYGHYEWLRINGYEWFSFAEMVVPWFVKTRRTLVFSGHFWESNEAYFIMTGIVFR